MEYKECFKELMGKTYIERISFLDELAKKNISPWDYGKYENTFNVLNTYAWNKFVIAEDKLQYIRSLSHDELIQLQVLNQLEKERTKEELKVIRDVKDSILEELEEFQKKKTILEIELSKIPEFKEQISLNATPYSIILKRLEKQKLQQIEEANEIDSIIEETKRFVELLNECYDSHLKKH